MKIIKKTHKTESEKKAKLLIRDYVKLSRNRKWWQFWKPYTFMSYLKRKGEHEWFYKTVYTEI